MNKLILKSIPASAGKTYDELTHRVRPNRTIYVCPSKSVVDTYYHNMRKNTSCKRVHVGCLEGHSTVTDAIITHLMESKDNLIITFHGLLRVDNKYIEDNGWEQLVLDDPQGVYKEMKLPFSSHYDPSDHLLIDEETGDVSPASVSIHDQFPNDNYIDFLHAYKLGKYTFKLSGTKQYKNEEGSDDYSTVHLIMIPTEKAFPNIDLKILMHEADEYPFVKLHGHKYDVIHEGLTHNRDMQERSVVIAYFDNERNGKSRKKNNKEIYSDRLESLKKYIKDDAIILKNVYDKYNLSTQWVPVNTNCHSSNDYQHISNVIITYSGNLTTEAIKAYKNECGFSDEYIYKLCNGSVAYQTVMRSSLRDYDSSEPVTVAVMDRYMAEYLKEQLETYHNFKVKLQYIKGLETVDKRKFNRGHKPKVWDNEHDRKKAGAIVKHARKGYYSDMLNTKILAFDQSKKRPALKNMALWDQVTVEGKYYQK